MSNEEDLSLEGLLKSIDGRLKGLEGKIEDMGGSLEDYQREVSFKLSFLQTVSNHSGLHSEEARLVPAGASCAEGKRDWRPERLFGR